MLQTNAPVNTVFVVCGPTAIGKTAAALHLAAQLNTEIISADSRQCYREMKIGTAKPHPSELRGIRHYFLDEFPVSQQLNAADFEQLSLQYLNSIFERHSTAVVCGGTGLYIKALCEGLDEMPAVDEAISHEVNFQYTKDGLPWLQEAVRKEDPDFFASGEIQNPARLLRALIFVRSTGASIVSFRTNATKKRPFRSVVVGMELPREELYHRINKRVEMMMEAGLLDEVRQLYPIRHLKNLQTVGYTELFDFLDGQCSLDVAVEKIKQNTRNYAKRQITWFKKMPGITWLNAAAPDMVSQILALR
jgi:tRNA dimethylallyltransferase